MIVKITTCYGETLFAQEADIARAKFMVPLCTEDGTPINESPGFKPGDAHMLAVENIEEMAKA